MSTPHPISVQGPNRVGVVLADLDKINVKALKYLVLHLNTLQKSVEFEFLAPQPNDPLLATLKPYAVVDREACRERLAEFQQRMLAYGHAEQQAYNLSDPTQPENFVVVSLARFSDEHYGVKKDHVQVQALGDWDREMAPPSILEFIIVLLMRQAISFAAPALSKSTHLGTKGCLFDFTPELSEARYKALQSFMCANCRKRLQGSGSEQLVEDFSRASDLSWLGLPSDPHCPAGIVANLGYNLFLTKGIQPTFWENVRSVLRDEATKEAIKIVFALLLAFLLLRLELKGAK